ncbi:MAG: DUF4349 domain-containing protein [Solirubrobacteraceae bacterium]
MSTPDTLTRELAALDDALAGRAVDPDLAGVAELAVALRDERPAPDPAFTRTLDTRVQRGFPRPATARRRRGIKWPRVTLPALGVAASVLLVVVIATSIPTGGSSDSGGGGASSSGTAATDQAGDTSTSAAPETATGSGSSSAAKSAPRAAAGGSAQGDSPAIAPLSPAVPTPGADGAGRRSVERSAELTLAAPAREIDHAASEIIRVTDELGGYVVSSTVSSNASGEFQLRVPERKLQTALSRLSRVAKVRGRTQSAQDITGAVVSVRGRLKDARTERHSLLRQLAKATTPNQTASIRARLHLVAGQIANAKRDLSRVQSRAIRSTIAVTLLADSESAGDATPGWTPGDALDDAVRILEVTAGVVLVGLALLLPLGLVGLLVWLAARQAAQRRRERALDAV